MCAPWGITISGGAPPYNITLAALGQPVVTNSTIPKTVVQNHLTYINRAIPGAQLVGEHPSTYLPTLRANAAVWRLPIMRCHIALTLTLCISSRRQ